MCTNTLKKQPKTSKTHIRIHKATLHNLKALSVDISRKALSVVTGVSGSGKSSLVFDTLFAEGQRRYVESLSTYARQFLGRMQKPPVGWIKGISPAVAIQQRSRTHNPRSTVGTMTEIYDYLRLLYARIGRTSSPLSGELVQRDSAADVLTDLKELKVGSKYQLAAPLLRKESISLAEQLRMALQKGYTRLLIDKEVCFIEDVSSEQQLKLQLRPLALLIDRGLVPTTMTKATQDRFISSVQTAFAEGGGRCFLQHGEVQRHFSEHFERDGLKFVQPSVHLFSFNSPQGACPTCEGFGQVIGIDPEKIVPDPSLSVYEGAIAPWRGQVMQAWLQPLLTGDAISSFPVHRPYGELSETEKELLWRGKGSFKGLDRFFEHLQLKKHKMQYRIIYARYRGKKQCPDCRGNRLRKEATYVGVGKYHLGELLGMSIDRLTECFSDLDVGETDLRIASFLLVEIRARLGYLKKVGLGYLTLSRLSSTLSGGEYQRIQLAAALGRPLVGAMYILDEPSIGLHPRDVDNLVEVLKALRDAGNPVIVVEHEERIMQAADELIDIGPGAGKHGGNLVFQGRYEHLSQPKNSYTAEYLRGDRVISLPKCRRQAKKCFRLGPLSMHNLKNITFELPLGVLSVLTGVSGSGKSTVVQDALCPALAYELGLSGGGLPRGYCLSGDYKYIRALQFVNQQPIGRSSRSNPATYLKAYDIIRQLFAQTREARQRQLKASHFSFNVPGGRCEACAGEGEITIEMQFMADLRLPCERCEGRRFSPTILDITYNGKSIDQVLNMSAEEALYFFAGQQAICDRLQALMDVGLGYICLGQSSSSLSGGEAQRVKLAAFLLKKAGPQQHTLFVFDEPTTGLHLHDIQRFLHAVQALVDIGHSVLVVEHNTEVIKCADWIIDLGPEAGDKGGEICFQGTPEALCKLKNNLTAYYLREKMR